MAKLKLGAKIGLGFGVLIMIALILGGMAVFNMTNVGKVSEKLATEYVPEVKIANDIERNALMAMFNNRGYAYTEDKSFLKNAEKYLKEVQRGLDEAQALADSHKDLIKLSEQVNIAKDGVSTYVKLTDETVKLNNKLASFRNEMDVAASDYMKMCTSYLATQNNSLKEEVTHGALPSALLERHKKITFVNDIIDLGNAARVNNFKAQATRNPTLLQQEIEAFDKIYPVLAELRKITHKQINIDQIDKVKAAGENYEQAMKDFITTWLKREELNKARVVAANNVLNASKATAIAGVKNTVVLSKQGMDDLNNASTVMLIGLATALILGILAAVFITRSITKPINIVITGLQEGSDQVASAAGQVSGSSQSLAEGASEQAAALEETTSSMEEMSSMTRQNAENAEQANTIMQGSSKTMKQASSSMSELRSAMETINRASDETAKIIRTIDEIAFQTNLLALNAAVEAARAGEAGSGFAVVADEVRSLAMRAAEAAKNTAQLIEENINDIKNGHNLVLSTEQEFTKVQESSEKAARLVAEIAAASKEQSAGISQVNTAMNEMDTVTQNNAANAEESAAAAEELSAQSETMKSFVDDLVSIVGNSNNSSKANNTRSAAEMTIIAQNKPMALPKPNLKLTEKREQKQEKSPEDVIPFDNADFNDF